MKTNSLYKYFLTAISFMIMLFLLSCVGVGGSASSSPNASTSQIIDNRALSIKSLNMRILSSPLMIESNIRGVFGGNIATNIAVDPQSNIYVLSEIEAGGNMNPVGIIDSILVKYSSNGNVAWTLPLGDPGVITIGTNIVTDRNGNVYIIGIKTGPYYLENGSTFVMKYDTNGNGLWGIKFNGSYGNTFGYGIALDSQNNVYVTGWTSDSIFPAYNTNIGTMGMGGQDYYIVKFSTDGAPLLYQQFGVGKQDAYIDTPGFAISVNSSTGNIYVAGSTLSAFPGKNKTGIQDYFIAKHDASGNQLWVQQGGDVNTYQRALRLKLDSSENAYFISYVANSSYVAQSSILVKYDSNGTMMWENTVGPSLRDVTIDSSGNSYVIGSTSSGIFGRQTGNLDFYIVQYNTSGRLISAKQVGYPGTLSLGYSITLNSNYLYVGGFYGNGYSLTDYNSYSYFVNSYKY